MSTHTHTHTRHRCHSCLNTPQRPLTQNVLLQDTHEHAPADTKCERHFLVLIMSSAIDIMADGPRSLLFHWLKKGEGFNILTSPSVCASVPVYVCVCFLRLCREHCVSASDDSIVCLYGNNVGSQSQFSVRGVR